MLKMFDNCEFVIEQNKKDIVQQFQGKIERLFDVKVSFLTNTSISSGMHWVGIRGDEGQRDKAKDYIKALTSPQQNSKVVIPASLVSRLGAGTTEHAKLEAEYGVVIRFPEENQAVISGNDVEVTLAASKLEDLKSTLLDKTAQTVSANRRNLEEFALKLGYEQEDITAVFDKLRPEVDRNTFLSELIKISKQKSRVTEDRRSPVSSGPCRGGYSRDMFPRYPVEMVTSKGAPTSSMNTLNGINSRGFATPENHGVVSRGCVRPPMQNPQASGPSPAYSAASRDYNMSVHQNNGMYLPSGNDFKQNSSDPRDPNQEEQMFQQLLTDGCRYKQFPQSDLRHIVIDGSNVAMSHGNNKVFSCKGIALCVEWFKQRGHTQITVFVPQWRKESAKPESPITDQHYLNQLEAQGYLTFTPSRRVNGRRIVCYDDRFVVRLAESTDGIIVSNDNFKDLAQENLKWKEVIERRLLMYSFVNDMFMPPDDPLGRHGPTLDELLHKGTPTQRRSCPYGRRCTYGARCKYHHPEREDKRLQVYQVLKDMFPNQDVLIVNVMRKYPQEKDPERLAIHILDMAE